MRRSIFFLLGSAFVLCACQSGSVETQPAAQPELPPGLIINSPAIRVGVSRESCTSMELQSDTQITWTNDDTVTLRVSLKQVDEEGNEMDVSSSEITPGGSFSTQLQEAGTYRFYCSDDVYGTIIVQ